MFWNDAFHPFKPQSAGVMFLNDALYLSKHCSAGIILLYSGKMYSILFYSRMVHSIFLKPRSVSIPFWKGALSKTLECGHSIPERCIPSLQNLRVWVFHFSKVHSIFPKPQSVSIPFQKGALSKALECGHSIAERCTPSFHNLGVFSNIQLLLEGSSARKLLRKNVLLNVGVLVLFSNLGVIFCSAEIPI